MSMWDKLVHMSSLKSALVNDLLHVMILVLVCQALLAHQHSPLLRVGALTTEPGSHSRVCPAATRRAGWRRSLLASVCAGAPDGARFLADAAGWGRSGRPVAPGPGTRAPVVGGPLHAVRTAASNRTINENHCSGYRSHP